MLVSTLILDALTEIGYAQPGESLNPFAQALGLQRLQGMIDGWGANQLTLSRQLRTTFTLPSGTSSVTVGAGQTVNITRPMFINSINYVVPGTSPAVESPIGIMDEDAYAAISIKALPSALPMQAFYQTNISDAYATLFFWPQVSQDVTIALYTPQAVDTPTSVNTNLIGPNGYQEAFLYQLALRLCTPLGIAVPPALPEMASRAWKVMTSPNVDPGVLGIDAALVPNLGAGYNILSDNMTAGSNR